ncbi:hypothetical protein J7L67_09565 [bacterium]|nr:hypothetical protein [bacterium]
MKRIFYFLISGLLVLLFFNMTVKPLYAAQTVKISILVIKASNNGNSVDPALNHLKSQLNRLNYSSYLLIKSDSKQDKVNGKVQFYLPDGDVLNVNLNNIGKSFITLDVSMFKAGMKTNFKIVNGGTVLIGGNEYEDGTLVIAITASY